MFPLHSMRLMFYVNRLNGLVAGMCCVNKLASPQRRSLRCIDQGPFISFAIAFCKPAKCYQVKRKRCRAASFENDFGPREALQKDAERKEVTPCLVKCEPKGGWSLKSTWQLWIAALFNLPVDTNSPWQIKKDWLRQAFLPKTPPVCVTKPTDAQ